jgi:hypothetical protein
LKSLVICAYNDRKERAHANIRALNEAKMKLSKSMMILTGVGITSIAGSESDPTLKKFIGPFEERPIGASSATIPQQIKIIGNKKSLKLSKSSDFPQTFGEKTIKPDSHSAKYLWIAQSPQINLIDNGDITSTKSIKLYNCPKTVKNSTINAVLPNPSATEYISPNPFEDFIMPDHHLRNSGKCLGGVRGPKSKARCANKSAKRSVSSPPYETKHIKSLPIEPTIDRQIFKIVKESILTLCKKKQGN